jgi:hypothetical protein
VKHGAIPGIGKGSGYRSGVISKLDFLLEPGFSRATGDEAGESRQGD